MQRFKLFLINQFTSTYCNSHAQGYALAAPGGPCSLTFAPRQRENVCFFIKILCETPWISQVQRLPGLSSIFLRCTALLLVLMQTDVLTMSNSYSICQIIFFILYEECLPCVALILYIYLLVHVLQGGTKCCPKAQG